MSDPANYRTREEINEMRSNHDPIEQVRKRLLHNKWASEGDLKEIEMNVRKIINNSVEFAQSDKEPDPAELYSDILI
ncbi:Dehydrogenase E1 component [Candidatus Liberibacter asiaticus]|nr:Dehydrogenase E1 component [Candidatus Liberibacter asiaticus]